MRQASAVVLLLITLIALSACTSGYASPSSSVESSSTPTPSESTPTIRPSATSITGPSISGTIHLGTLEDFNVVNGKVVYFISKPTTRFGPNDEFWAVINVSGPSCSPSASYSFTDGQGNVFYTWQQQLVFPPDPCGATQIVASPWTPTEHTLGAVLPSGAAAGTYLMTVSLQDAKIAPASFTYAGS